MDCEYFVSVFYGFSWIKKNLNWIFYSDTHILTKVCMKVLCVILSPLN